MYPLLRERSKAYYVFFVVLQTSIAAVDVRGMIRCGCQHFGMAVEQSLGVPLE